MLIVYHKFAPKDTLFHAFGKKVYFRHQDRPFCIYCSMKIYVYAICKNEERFVDRWMDSMRDADGVFVLDTGSTDRTVARLKARGATVNAKQYDFFRFDVARNDSLAFVPQDADACVCTDLDEVFDKGWRQEIEKAWQDGCNRLFYRYVWKTDADGRESVVFWSDKIHARNGWKWKYAAHEVLTSDSPAAFRHTPSLCLRHFPDEGKDRSDYLSLLSLSAVEHPSDARVHYYLGREYLFGGDYASALACFERYLTLPSPWAEEKTQVLRFAGLCHESLGSEKAETCYEQAICLSPRLREPYVDYAGYLLRRNQVHGAIFFLQKALTKTQPSYEFCLDTSYYGALPYDLLSLAYYALGDGENGVRALKTALSYEPNNLRLLQNLLYFV